MADIIRNTTATINSPVQYQVKPIDGQLIIEPGTTYTWTMANQGIAGKFNTSPTGSPTVSVTWLQATNEGSFHTLECRIVNSSCDVTLQLKVTVESTAAALTTTISYDENLCVKAGDDVTYTATSDNASKIIWNVTGGNFVTDLATLVQGPYPRTPIGNSSSVTVRWNNTNAHQISAYSINGTNTSNTDIIALDIPPQFTEHYISGDTYLEFGEKSYANITCTVPNLNRYPDSWKIKMNLYVGVLVNGGDPNGDDTNYQGINWVVGGTPIDLANDELVGNIGSNTYSEIHQVQIPSTQNGFEHEFYRFVFVPEVYNPANVTCKVTGPDAIHELEFYDCPTSASLIYNAGIVAEKPTCVTSLNFGNISGLIDPCQDFIRFGDIESCKQIRIDFIDTPCEDECIKYPIDWVDTPCEDECIKYPIDWVDTPCEDECIKYPIDFVDTPCLEECHRDVVNFDGTPCVDECIKYPIDFSGTPCFEDCIKFPVVFETSPCLVACAPLVNPILFTVPCKESSVIF